MKDIIIPLVNIKYTRKATVVEQGGIEISCKNPEELQQKLEQRDFKQFLPTNREYSDEDWSFELLVNNDD